jgi:hypothetical protein
MLFTGTRSTTTWRSASGRLTHCARYSRGKMAAPALAAAASVVRFGGVRLSAAFRPPRRRPVLTMRVFSWDVFRGYSTSRSPR